MPNWLMFLPLNLIYQISEARRVNPSLIAAIVSVESSGKTCATRYEPNYRWLYEPDRYARLNNVTVDTEVINQKTSWGLMQVMGAVARENGHMGYLTELCEPRNGLLYGIDYLASLIDKYGSIEDAVSAYNQGSPKKSDIGIYKNQNYVDKVMTRYYALNTMKMEDHL